MNRKKLIALALLGVLAIGLGLWVGLMGRSANIAARAIFDKIVQGEVPQGFSGSLERMAQDIGELKPQYRIQRVRLVTPIDAQVEVLLEVQDMEAVLHLEMARRGGKWQVEVPETRLAIQMVEEEPKLVLFVDGEDFLQRSLEPLGEDKLLTLQVQNTEWLNQGWMETAPYFSTLHQGEPTRLLVGMDAKIFSYRGRLVAALTDPFSYENIRVNLSTTQHEGISHRQVTLASDSPWQALETVSQRSVDLPPGQVRIEPQGSGLTLLVGDEKLEFDNRLIFTTQGAGLELRSITRYGGRTPVYRGHIEVANFDGQLVVVNELPLEEYLYSVVPSEMPASFGQGALELQAIVARTYSVRNMLSSSWQQTSAHVVDSVLSQVYNNLPENAPSVAAVDATRGEIVARDGVPMDVKFFSTSSGFTANSHEVWPDGNGNFPGNPVEWLRSRPQFPKEYEFEDFASFIHNPPVDAFDEASSWFRWQVEVPSDRLGEVIQENLISIQQSSPSSVLRRANDGTWQQVDSVPTDALGELMDLVPAQRGEGGVLMAVDIVGSRGTWRVLREYNIRHVIRPLGTNENPISLTLNHGNTLENFSILPSAFVVWKFHEMDEKLTSITFYGGGFGHGVGMSQHGVRELVERGWTREDIIDHYFPGTVIKQLYP